MKTNRLIPSCSEVQKRGSVERIPLKERIRRRLTEHVSNCPCCQKRLALAGRVEIAFSLLKSQPLTMDLLSRANSSALGMLKHSLRYSPESEKLRVLRSEQTWFGKIRPFFEHVLNVAACLFVLLMIRSGVFSSLTDYKQQGETALHNYYARNLDQKLMNEIFPDDTTQA
jgi:hypothetical protein